MMMNQQHVGLRQEETPLWGQTGTPFPPATSNQQDFCYGAKGLNSPHSAFLASTPPSSSICSGQLDEWMEIRESLGGDLLETFSDVILPKDEFKSEEVFDSDIDFFFNNEFSPQFNEYSPIDQSGTDTIYDPVTQLPNEDKKEKLTIKLKKVTIRKNSNKSAEYKVLNPGHIESNLTPPTKGNFKNTFVPVLEENNSSAFAAADFNETSGLTLKDALNMEDANLILESLISPPDSSANYLESWNDNSSFCDQSPVSDFSELFSPLSSSGISSCGSEHYSDAWSTLESSSFANSEDQMNVSISTPDNDRQTIESKRPSNQKSRKAKQKLSAESRYLRKKEQNKQAALRYRVKKKLEDEILSGELKKEEDENERLRKEYSTMKQELSFIKKLLRETLIAKEVVPPDAFD